MKMAHKGFRQGNETPPRLARVRAKLSRFKDVVYRYPQTTAYATIGAICFAGGSISPNSPKDVGEVGMLGLGGMICAALSFMREKHMGGIDKIKKIISGSVAAAGFIAGAALTFVAEGLAQRSGVITGVFTAFAAMTYAFYSSIQSNGLKPLE